MLYIYLLLFNVCWRMCTRTATRLKQDAPRSPRVCMERIKTTFNQTEKFKASLTLGKVMNSYVNGPQSIRNAIFTLLVFRCSYAKRQILRDHLIRKTNLRTEMSTCWGKPIPCAPVVQWLHVKKMGQRVTQGVSGCRAIVETVREVRDRKCAGYFRQCAYSAEQFCLEKNQRYIKYLPSERYLTRRKNISRMNPNYKRAKSYTHTMQKTT